jgi:AP-3 complex subunit beta
MSYFGEEVLPDWLERGVESVLRDSDEGENAGSLPSHGMSGFGSRGVGGSSLQGQEKVMLVPTSGNVVAGGSGTSTPAGSLRGPWTDLDDFYREAEKKEEGMEEEDSDDDDESDDEDIEEEDDDDDDGNEDDDDDDEEEEEEESQGEELNELEQHERVSRPTST